MKRNAEGGVDHDNGVGGGAMKKGIMDTKGGGGEDMAKDADTAKLVCVW